jgi:hypothetical protein
MKECNNMQLLAICVSTRPVWRTREVCALRTEAESGKNEHSTYETAKALRVGREPPEVRLIELEHGGWAVQVNEA